jgi:hypothetical protein
MIQPVRLATRSVLEVRGPDADVFLNGLLTQSTLTMSAGERRYGALLTPQGRIIADMIIHRTEDGFDLDCARVAEEETLRRLTLFKLRSRVIIQRRDDRSVFGFGTGQDPRSPQAPRRDIQTVDTPSDPGSLPEFERTRILAGLPEQGVDFGIDEVYPADINMDLLNGVDFRKGCFVGQEVVSRMKRRGLVRRRTIKVRLDVPPDALPAPVFVDGIEIGTVTSRDGEIALARLRVDKLTAHQGVWFCALADGSAATVIGPDMIMAELGPVPSD